MNEYNNSEMFSLRDYIKIFFRQKTAIVVTFFAVLILAGIVSQFRTPLYQAEVKMLSFTEKQFDDPYASYTQSRMKAITHSEIIKSYPIIERVVLALKLYERPVDYEKKYCTKIRGQWIDMQMSFSEKFKNIFDKFKSKKIEGEFSQASPYQETIIKLGESIKVKPVKDTNLFTIAVRDFSPVEAARIANVISRYYVIFDLEMQLSNLQLKYGEKNELVNQLKQNIKKLSDNITGDQITSAEAIGPAEIKIIEQANIPLKPVKILKKTWMVILLVISFAAFISILCAFIFEGMDQTFKSPMDIENFFHLPLLGYIPKVRKSERKLIQELNNKNIYNKSYQALSEQMQLLINDRNLKSILMLSALPGEGKTILTANLGKYMAVKLNKKILIIDANFRFPSLHSVFEINGNTGFANILEGKDSIENAVKKIENNLSVLPAGNTLINPITLLYSPRMAEVMSDLKQKHEIILIDCVYLRDYKDGVVLSPYAEGIVLVVDESKTRRHVVKNAMEPFNNKKNNLIGVILNNRRFVIPKMFYDRI